MPLSKRSTPTDFFGLYPRYPSPRPISQTPPPNQLQQNYSRSTTPQQPSALDDLSYIYRSAKARLSGKMREIDPLISEYTHMREMPDAERALHTLRKIASCVKPIMRKRGWRVGTLSEFYPEQQNLLGLNVNRGSQILIRLRYPHNRKSFLPFEHALDTMLHELCHIIHGPHDHKFQSLWQELRDEWDALSLKGYTGEGFLSAGRPVGGSSILPRDEMRRRARAEAALRERERKKHSASGGRVLGGKPVPGASIRDVIADAVIRRTSASTKAVQDGCGTGTKAGMQAAADALLNGFTTKEEMDEANALAIQRAAMELMAMDEERILRRDDERLHPTHQNTPSVPTPASEGLVWDPIHGLQPAPNPHAPRSAPPLPSSSKPHPTNHDRTNPNNNRPLSRLVKEADSKRHAKPTQPQTMLGLPAPSWECEICTLVNVPTATRCDACEVERPRVASTKPVSSKPLPPAPTQQMAGLGGGTGYSSATGNSLATPAGNLRSVGWNCLWCGNFMENQWWTCDVCGKMKDHS